MKLLTEIEILYQILEMYQGDREHSEAILRVLHNIGYRTRKQKSGIRIWPALQKHPISLRVGSDSSITEQDVMMMVPILQKIDGCSIIRGASAPFIEKMASMDISMKVQSDIVMIYGRSGESDG